MERSRNKSKNPGSSHLPGSEAGRRMPSESRSKGVFRWRKSPWSFGTRCTYTRFSAVAGERARNGAVARCGDVTPAHARLVGDRREHRFASPRERIRSSSACARKQTSFPCRPTLQYAAALMQTSRRSGQCRTWRSTRAEGRLPRALRSSSLPIPPARRHGRAASPPGAS